MTRLRTEDIADVGSRLDQYNLNLVRKTGRNLGGIACHASGVTEFGRESDMESDFWERLASTRLGVVPISSGEGRIEGFTQAVRDIAAYLGFEAFVATRSDAAGMAQTVEKRADIVMLADDNRFVAIHLQRRLVIDNAGSTARGYVAGLDLMTGGLKGKRCLVIGWGPVGRQAASTLIHMGVGVSVYDIHAERSKDLGDRMKRTLGADIRIMDALAPAVRSHGIIIDATNSGGIIHRDEVTSETYIAAPGMPLGVTPAARARIGDRLLHDPLQIGVATMAVRAMVSGA